MENKTLHEIAFEKLSPERGKLVQVVAVIKDGVHGNNMTWETGMNLSVGKTLKIRDIDTNDQTIALENGYWYSALALEIPKITVELPSYKAVISADAMTVNNEVIKGDKLLELANAALATGLIKKEDLKFNE